MSFLIQIYYHPLFDWFYTLLAFIAIVLIILCLELIYIKLNIPNTITRKILHIIIGILICVSVIFIHTNLPIIIISIIFIIFNFWAIIKQKLKSIHIDSQSYGTIYYPIAVLILVLILWPQYKLIFILSVLIMSISDTFAAIIGNKLGKKYYIFIAEKKSVIGSMAMFFVTFIILFIGICTIFGFDYINKSRINKEIVSLYDENQQYDLKFQNFAHVIKSLKREMAQIQKSNSKFKFKILN